MPISSGTYAAAISRQHPGCLVFLIDQSGSMARRIAGGDGQQKKVAVADAINRLLYNTALRCAKEDGVRPYFDVGVFGYGANGDVSSAFAPDLLSVTAIAERPLRIETRRRQGAGGDAAEDELQLPIWFEPVADGQTLMSAAFQRATVAITEWIARHPDSFPPVVVNVTDGGYTDRHPGPIVARLRELATRDGHVLVFNCVLSEKGGTPIAFPGDRAAAALKKKVHEMFELSSPLPEPIRRQAQAKGYAPEPDARGFAYNADLVTLIDFLEVGTRAVQDRQEAD